MMYDRDIFANKEFIDQEYRYGEICRYLERYIEYESLSDHVENNITVKVDHTIWLFWYQGIDHAPLIVKKCVASIMNNCPKDFDVILLDKNNLSEYVSLPLNISEKHKNGKITDTHFSDILRAYLLSHYGGCWIDATVYCMGGIPREFMSGDVFLFKISGVLCDPVIKTSSWWIYAKKNNPLLSSVYRSLRNYWSDENELVDYFLFHLFISILVSKDKRCRKMFAEMFYFNSGNAHVLSSKLDKEYSAVEWNSYKQSSLIQKLSYKERFLNGDIYSNYVHIISMENCRDTS